MSYNIKLSLHILLIFNNVFVELPEHGNKVPKIGFTGRFSKVASLLDLAKFHLIFVHKHVIYAFPGVKYFFLLLAQKWL